MIKKFKITIAYDGTDFVGWQRQSLPKAYNRSVQGELEKSLKKIFKHPVTLRGAGRTDSGVHAIGQVAAFEVDCSINSAGVMLALNSLLPGSIRITHCQQVDHNFHPRYDAVGKTYCYLLSVGSQATAFNYTKSHFIKHNLDLQAMSKGTRLFMGVHNFESFTAKGNPVMSYEKEIYQCQFTKLPQPQNLLPWQEIGEIWQLVVTGSGFMYKMVRLIMGSLLYLGKGKLQESHILEALANPGEIIAPPAPACGLYLQGVHYEPFWLEPNK